MERLRKEKFDIGLSEFFDVCGFGIFNKIGLDRYIILYSSLLPSVHAAQYGIPPTPSYVPEMQSKPPPFNFLKRVQNEFSYLISTVTFNQLFIDRVAEAFPGGGVHENAYVSSKQ
jgi:hypothetical protein